MGVTPHMHLHHLLASNEVVQNFRENNNKKILSIACIIMLCLAWPNLQPHTGVSPVARELTISTVNMSHPVGS